MSAYKITSWQQPLEQVSRNSLTSNSFLPIHFLVQLFSLSISEYLKLKNLIFSLRLGSFGRVLLSKNKKNGEYFAMKRLKKADIIKLR